MKYYLKHIESIDRFTIACYSNDDELLFEKEYFRQLQIY